MDLDAHAVGLPGQLMVAAMAGPDMKAMMMDGLSAAEAGGGAGLVPGGLPQDLATKIMVGG